MEDVRSVIQFLYAFFATAFYFFWKPRNGFHLYSYCSCKLCRGADEHFRSDLFLETGVSVLANYLFLFFGVAIFCCYFFSYTAVTAQAFG